MHHTIILGQEKTEHANMEKTKVPLECIEQIIVDPQPPKKPLNKFSPQNGWKLTPISQ